MAQRPRRPEIGCRGPCGVSCGGVGLSSTPQDAKNVTKSTTLFADRPRELSELNWSRVEVVDKAV